MGRAEYRGRIDRTLIRRTLLLLWTLSMGGVRDRESALEMTRIARMSTTVVGSRTQMSTAVADVSVTARRRFTRAAAVGLIVAAVPFLWFLWVDWSGSVHPFRYLDPNYLFDYQAEAIIHGHLWVANGSLRLEGFVHDGHTYTYYGPLLSLLRIPILLVVPRALGHLTAPSILVAWMVAGLFTSLLVWRVRVQVRGPVALGRAEAVSLGTLVAVIAGGSVMVFLASQPWVYDEDLIWSVAITTATLFALLGVLERPSRGRVLAAGALVLAGNLGRLPAAWGCVVGALLIAVWFALGRSGAANRRWALPMVPSASSRWRSGERSIGSNSADRRSGSPRPIRSTPRSMRTDAPTSPPAEARATACTSSPRPCIPISNPSASASSRRSRS